MTAPITATLTLCPGTDAECTFVVRPLPGVSDYSLHVVGGVMPDGEDRWVFATVADALDAAARIARDLIDEAM